MVHFSNLAFASILGSAISVLALPVAAPAPTPAAKLESRGTSCTFSGSEGAASVSASKSNCATIVLSDIAVPSGTTLDLTKLKDNTVVEFQGTTTFGYKEWLGPLVSVSGTGITVRGAKGSVLDGDGIRWWDTQGTNGGKKKPKFFYAHKMIDSSISGITIKNSPVQVFSVNGAENLSISGVTVDNTDGDKTSNGKTLGHNTDAFDVSSSRGIHIEKATVKNQDDCLAINSGTDISFTNSECFRGHGISIGSVGGRDNNDVANVYIAGNTIADSENGVRIKTVYEASGSVKNVTYKDITLSNISKNGIVIQQDYQNGNPTGTATSGVPITDVTIDNVSGTVDSSANDVFILCAACSNWSWSGVSITGGKSSSNSTGIPAGANW